MKFYGKYLFNNLIILGYVDLACIYLAIIAELLCKYFVMFEDHFVLLIKIENSLIEIMEGFFL